MAPMMIHFGGRYTAFPIRLVSYPDEEYKMSKLHTLKFNGNIIIHVCKVLQKVH